jgi:CheY-like chemotaxis protein
MRSILIIEDEEISRRNYVSVMKKMKWKVTEASNGEEALSILKKRSDFDIILLDIRMPIMNGIELIKIMKKKKIPTDNIIVITAHVDDNNYKEEISSLSIDKIFKKPIFSREKIRAIVDETFTERKVYSDLNKIVKNRETALCNYIKDNSYKSYPLSKNEPLLIVARRWNSWYPSYFNVDGGSYAILGTKAENNELHGAIIDPGFKALSVLNKINVPVSCLDTCIITHNHPDHIGGVFEYFTVRHVLGKDTTIYCSKSAHEILKTYSGFGMNIVLFENQDEDVIKSYNISKRKRIKIRAMPLVTSHHGMGQQDETRGIILSSESANENEDFVVNSTVVLLGDTEYHTSTKYPNHKIFNDIREAFKTEKLKVAILHIGSTQLKEGTGKHLYINGLIALLRDINEFRKQFTPDNQKIVVLVSEWGLEHASHTQINKSLPFKPSISFNKNDNSGNLIIATIDKIKENFKFENIVLIPADVGLVVGMETGRVYIKGTKAVIPESIKYKSSKKGLNYFVKVRNE